ncbi:rRNA maturation RNase YbeY, partial [Gemmatimonas aurantiaca]|nr:rRNA maturation RNase YbeY [Gemmatimonas aurantiaca]
MKLSVNKEIVCRIPRARLHRLAEIIARKECIDSVAALNLVLVDDVAQRRMNSEYRNRNMTTDVLSFSYESDEFSQLIGEIYISVPQTRKQAMEFGYSFSEELLRLFCHGLLHIVGYDH